MKTFLIAGFSALVLLASCSTYRGTQTPDDIYYSSSPKVAAGGRSNAANDDYVQANSSRNDGKYDQSYNGYQDYATPDDRWLMMRVRDRSRWSVFDDYNNYSPYNDFSYGGMGGYGMGYSPYGYTPGLSLGFGSGFYSPYYSFGLGLGYGAFGSGYFNNYYNWNSCYNPYFYNSIAVNPKLNPAGYTTMRNFNLGGYNNRNYSTNTRTPSRPNYNGYVNPSSTPSRIYYNNNGNANRRVFSNNNNSTLNNGGYNQSYDRPVRTYSPSSNSSYSPRSSGFSGSTGGGYSGGGGASSGGSAGSRPSRH